MSVELGSVILASVAVLGCNQILGLDRTHEVAATPDAAMIDADTRPDLDHDGIPDPIDPCIASVADLTLDYDGDGSANGVDPCPFDSSAVPGADTDNDGIPDICDPFPAAAGDEQRCAMLFEDASLDLALWHTRTGPPWNIANHMLAGTGDGTLVSVESFEAPDVTVYDVFGTLNGNASQVGAVQIFARTTGAATDAGCELRGDGTTAQLAVLGGATSSTSLVASTYSIFRMRVTLEPTEAMNVRCELRLFQISNPSPMIVAGHVDLTPGTFGVTIENATVSIVGIATYHRQDVQPLP